MIVAAYAGAGKSTFAQRVEGAIDLVTMPHSWILPPADGNSGEFEGEKGAEYFLRDPRYPDNYILDVLKAEARAPYVLIPTNIWIIRRLREEYGRTVVLCYPTPEQKEDYRRRFLARGNREEFLALFVDDWERFLTPFWEGEVPGVPLPLQPGEFLLDKKALIDQAAREDHSQPVTQAVIEGLEEELDRERSAYALLLSGCREDLMYPIRDLQDPEERAFLYRLGRAAWEGATLHLIIEPRSILERPGSALPWTEDRQKVVQFVEREKKATNFYP